MKRSLLTLLVFACLVTVPALAQGRGHRTEFVIAPNRAVIATRDVLVAKGYEVVRMEIRGDERTLYYRRGNMGRGKGKGPMQKLIIRRIENRVVFVDTPDVILADINIKLKL